MKAHLRRRSLGLVLGLASTLAVVAMLRAGATQGPRKGKPKAERAGLGAGANLGGRRPFADDCAFNREIADAPVDPDSDRYIAQIGLDKPLHPDFGRAPDSGIPFVVVSGTQAGVAVTFQWADESDPGPYPIPPEPPIEGGEQADGDRHLLIVDRDHWKLFELARVFPPLPGDGGSAGGAWRADAGAIFDLATLPARPAGWTSADAAGLPIFPLLVRYEEAVERREIRHALRFTVRRTRRAYVAPASHFASRATDPRLPPMGLRVRLKKTVDLSRFPPSARVILQALRRYGMILADNGNDWFLTGAPDPRWNDEELATLKRIRGIDLEVVALGEVVSGK